MPVQLDSSVCVGNAGEEFIEGSGRSNLTHPFAGNARGQIFEKEVVIPT